MTLREPPVVSGEQSRHGHLEELRTDPISLMNRVREECGDVGKFRLADRQVVLLSGRRCFWSSLNDRKNHEPNVNE